MKPPRVTSFNFQLESGPALTTMILLTSVDLVYKNKNLMILCKLGGGGGNSLIEHIVNMVQCRPHPHPRLSPATVLFPKPQTTHILLAPASSEFRSAGGVTELLWEWTVRGQRIDGGVVCVWRDSHFVFPSWHQISMALKTISLIVWWITIKHMNWFCPKQIKDSSPVCTLADTHMCRFLEDSTQRHMNTRAETYVHFRLMKSPTKTPFKFLHYLKLAFKLRLVSLFKVNCVLQELLLISCSSV